MPHLDHVAIWVADLDMMLRIRTGEMGENAL